MTGFKEQEYTKKFDFSIWKKLFAYLKRYKVKVILLTIVMIAVGGIDALFPFLNKHAIDHFVVEKTMDGLVQFGIFYLIIIIVQIFNVFALIMIAGKIEMDVCYQIRKDSFNHLQQLSFSFYDKTPVGWLMARMTSDVGKIGRIISWGLVDMIWGFSMMIGIGVFMFILNAKLAWIALSVTPPLVIISIYFQQLILKNYRQVRKNNSQITGAFNEGIMGAKTTKTLVVEEKHFSEFSQLTDKMRNASIRAAIVSSLYLPIILLLGSIGTGLVIWFGGLGVADQLISYGTLVAFVSYTVQFFDPIREMARVLSEFQAAQASAERIISLMETELDIKEKEDVVNYFGNHEQLKKENWPQMTGEIHFDQVDFRYKEGEKILSNFNLKIKAGENIALVGHTGSGKSTIVNLACRFYEPTQGSVLIDGVDYRERSQVWLHSHLGYVLQAPHLFSGTIRENIRYGCLSASDEDIEKAAKLVRLHPFVEKMANGYDTEVGENGNRLSTGEKQLVSFARAILANPRIFVLDEATSSVDTETEKIIQDAISKVLKGRTSFIIAHRLSTIRNADRIIVIDQGKILEEGTHHQLMALKKHYYELYTNQYQDELFKRLG
ncbi:MAG: ABC transporter ATP-binding protein/permease [Spirochaetes bacterium]|nr:ABC transporter ATP-binding protein/permease [Spirochaetota bacterium]